MEMARNLEASTHIGQLIHQGLVTSGLKEQRRLAMAAGLDESYISHLMKADYQRPDRDIMRRIANALGQNIELYYAALLKDRGELPEPDVYLCTMLNLPIRKEDAEVVMTIAEKLGRANLRQ
jgi:transcriptional regulator with XRE-family HTH domain